MKTEEKAHPSLALLHVEPVLVELDNVGVFDLHQVLKHLLNLLLDNTHKRRCTFPQDIMDHIRALDPQASINKADEAVSNFKKC